MKKNILTLLLASFATISFAQSGNPFVPPKAGASTPALSPATLAGVPLGPNGQPLGPNGQPLPPHVPPVPGGQAASEPAQPDPEVRVRFVGKVNGQNVYKADSQYHFDKRKRPPVQLVEDSATPAAAPVDAKPTR